MPDPDDQAANLAMLATMMHRKGMVAQSRRVLARASASGSWDMTLMALAAIDPDILRDLVELEAPHA